MIGISVVKVTSDMCASGPLPLMAAAIRIVPARAPADSNNNSSRPSLLVSGSVSPEEAAAVMKAKSDMQLDGGIVIANPVPEGDALDPTEISAVIEAAISEMNNIGIIGKDTTPFLLAKIAEVTKGRSLTANSALVLNNAKLAAQIAVAFHA